MNIEPLLKVRDLKVHFYTLRGVVHALERVSFELKRQETLGLAGETGCGKSVTARSVLRLIDPPGQILKGRIIFEGQDLLTLDETAMRRIRGSEISMIMQEPKMSLNPVIRVGDQIAETLIKAKLIYLLGGFPRYLAEVLNGSDSWQAILNAFQSGAVIAGSSAGAMVLCKYYYDPLSSRVVEGLNLVKHIFILPHHNTYGKDWFPLLKHQLPEIILFGIDEETGVLYNPSQGNWRVYGKGQITLYNSGHVDKFEAGQAFALAN